jgi:hypothetical protein
MKRVISTAVAVFIGLVAPASAGADAKPTFTEGPAVAGIPRESEVLTATAAWTGDPAPTVSWRWQRCEKSNSTKCTAIAGAASPTYRVVAADVGSRLRVRIRLENSAGQTAARSEPTSPVEPAPAPEPEPTPEPTPEPQPEPEPEPEQNETPPSASPPVAFDAPANPVIGPPVAGEAQPPLLRPFPRVRIRGWLTRSGARVTLLAVRAPRGARIATRCRGRSCPVRRLARTATSTRLRAFQRRLRAGTRLDITVTKSGYIGKWTTIVIRKDRPPRRADRCVYPGARRPAPCPTE